ncbi:OprD family porin [Pseudomonas jinjuensis]|uniref:Outer membrane porin, OprD family n=1 Tax=Pseudomonas jinjuensis TaxID=198616 RepID=A0A1H0AHK6_9PSED|nr:OprD family porin [Pseudomonas jinjuensis]SDN32834.1 outer membrane porin, OprD family [Pseudomonas jinjuensis]
MSKTPIARAVALAALGTSLTLPTLAQAEFIKDSKASVELRNFYFNRDLRQDNDPVPTQNKQEEWAQGFILKYESGFTEGTVGFGLDALADLGLKLDSSPDRSGSGLLQRDRETGRAQDSYNDFGATAKVRVSKTTLKGGTLLPKLPVVQYNDTRLLPQTFSGAWLNSLDIDNLTLDGGRLYQVNQRDSSDYEDLTMTGGGKRNITGTVATNEFAFGGLGYKWTDNLTTSYYYGELEDNYSQHYLNLVHVLPIADKQSLKSDIRWARSNDEGDTNVDNKALNAMFTYSLGFHAFGLGYQKMSGDTGFAYLTGTDPFLVNYVQIGDFANKDEKSWQARYDYNFAGIGIPGLTFMTRYVTGDDVDQLSATTSEDGKEWERNMDIAYVFQEGPLKNLGIKWRNATVRSNFANDLDENRLIVSYVMPLW